MRFVDSCAFPFIPRASVWNISATGAVYMDECGNFDVLESAED